MKNRKSELTKIKNWLEKQGWGIHNNKSIEFELPLLASKLENIGAKPDFLIEKDGLKFYCSIFIKTIFPFAQSKDMFYTGIDWYKYQYLYLVQLYTDYKVALIMYSKEDNKVIFRQLDQLPKPQCWFKEREISKGCGHLGKNLQCLGCWKQNNQVVKTRRKKKTMAVWNIDEFSQVLAIQTSMI